MFKYYHRILPLYPILLIIYLSVLACPTDAFPLRYGEDCFYGEGEPDETGVSTWMGYAIEFTPPYTPYTLDGISIYISQMLLAQDQDRTMMVSVLDEQGVRRQYTEISWRELEGHTGWVSIGLSDRAYDGPFTVILHSGAGRRPQEAYFRLGTDSTATDRHSMVYTDQDSPPPPPFGVFSETELAQQAECNLARLAPMTNSITSFPDADWMIRAHAPNLQLETTRVFITMADIEAFNARGTIPVPDWTLPPIEGLGPRGTVHCPSSLAGVTLYYWEDDPGQKFSNPHDGPWAHPDLIRALGAFCQDLHAEGVVGIEHIGIYNDRNIYGTNTRSSHAYGLGIDLAGFKYADGRVYMVEDHDDPAVRAVLEHIRDDYLVNYFPTVIDWTYQRHENHFHVNLPYPG